MKNSTDMVIKIYWPNNKPTIVENASQDDVTFVIENYCYKNAACVGVVVHDDNNMWYHLNDKDTIRKEV